MPLQIYKRLITVALAFFMAAVANAQPSWPDRPIRLIVPFAAGGGSDVIARDFGARLSGLLGQPVVIENRTGAGLNIGAVYVAKSPPDGYTLLMGSPALWLNPLTSSDMPYTLDEFLPVSTLARAPFVLSATATGSRASLAELVTYGKANPGKLNYAILGVGGTPHLVSKLFEREVGMSAANIPYRGTGQVWPDLMSGRVDFYFDTIGTSLPLYRSSKIRILAIASEERWPAAPEIPTFKELGYPKVVVDAIWGVFAPAGTPPAIVEKLSRAIREASETGDLRARLLAGGTVVQASTPAGFSAAIQKDLAIWRPIVKSLNLRSD